MPFMKYFEKNTSIDRPSNTKGVLYIDDHANKSLGNVTRESIDQTLMSSYKNRSAILDDVIVTANGRIYKNNQFIGEIIGCRSDDVFDTRILDNKVYDYVISISGVWTYGIWHFPTEALSALMKCNIPDNALIHVHSKTNYVMYWLSLIGIQKNRVIEGNIHAKKLFIPELGYGGSPYPEQIDWLSNIVKKSVKKREENLLILIKRTKSRVLKNYNEVHDKCKELAKEMNLTLYIHDDDKLPSVKDQHIAFKSAKILVAPHGGGNINLLAMDEDTTFIEIMDDKWPNKCFLRVAVHMNINYYGVSSKNWIADIKSLSDVFKKISNK